MQYLDFPNKSIKWNKKGQQQQQKKLEQEKKIINTSS